MAHPHTGLGNVEVCRGEVDGSPAISASRRTKTCRSPFCRHRFDAPLTDIGNYDGSLKKALNLKSPRIHDHIAHRNSVQVQSIAVANQENKHLRCSKPR